MRTVADSSPVFSCGEILFIQHGTSDKKSDRLITVKVSKKVVHRVLVVHKYC